MSFAVGNGACVYGYINIDTSSPGSTESALIHIRVPVAWYEQNELDPTTTTVTHCGAESVEWEVLEVVSSSVDEDYYFFTVRTPGFSEFAVGALPFGMDAMFPVESEDVDTTTYSGHLGDSTEERVTSSMWLLPVIAGILGIFFFVLWKRRKDEEDEQMR
ncbi:PGF-pre-PGF domain-containing protein [Methanococcoides methylutens]|uniref:PGF-pre-PGF domain-containing protein n=1 Tax=Methanococcoides methylutens TaxID=2226 RepID=UPI0009DDA412|nr:PGF-pre-PGF domain-containing protein [Methanococcoides methylutens]